MILLDNLDYENGRDKANLAISNGKGSCIGSCQTDVESAMVNGVRVVVVSGRAKSDIRYVTTSFAAAAGTVGLSDIDVESTGNAMYGCRVLKYA